MRIPFHILIWCSFFYFQISVEAYAQIEKYLEPKPTGRLALVIGNADYETATKLPGNIADAKNISGILKDVGFDVTYASDVRTRQQFLELYFLPFIAKIQRDDFVVFYFSGHGFSYEGENYLLPLRFPLEVFDTEIPSTFLSAKAMQRMLSEANPGALLMFLDACRNVADFIKVKPKKPDAVRDPDRVPKALSAMHLDAGNIVISFSSDAGKTSEGSSVSDKLSVYTAALSKFLPAEDTEFDTVRKDVREEVLFHTEQKQVPWFSESSSAEIYFKPTKLVFDQERVLWEGILRNRERREVIRFLRRHSISRYAHAARQWLDDNPVQASAGFTRISPIAVELAWDLSGGVTTADQSSAKLRNVTGPLAFARVMTPTDSGAVTPSVKTGDVLATGDLPIKREKITYASGEAELFAKHGEAVVAGRVAAYERPRDDAKTVADIKPGAKLKVIGYTKDKNEKAWVKASYPLLPNLIYIPISEEGKSGAINIGKPLLEVEIPRAGKGLQSAIDEQVVLAAVSKLHDNKSSIERISISTPKTDDLRLADIYGERARYLVQVLNRAGIDPTRVTTWSGATDLKGDDLRMRIFGN